MTPDDICVMAIKAGFRAHIAHGEPGIYAKPSVCTDAELGAMLTTFARHVEAQVRREAKS